jgi:putative chitinase
VITSEQLAEIMGCTPKYAAGFVGPINAAMQEFGITTPIREACFLAQLGHECAGLTRFVEGASGAAYDTGRLAVRLGNTPEADGDGQRYRGRGAIQITGLANVKAASEFFGIDFVSDPGRLDDLDVTFRIAGWFWQVRTGIDLSKFADCVPALGFDAFNKITRRINGGENGRPDRERRLVIARRVLGC